MKGFVDFSMKKTEKKKDGNDQTKKTFLSFALHLQNEKIFEEGSLLMERKKKNPNNLSISTKKKKRIVDDDLWRSCRASFFLNK